MDQQALEREMRVARGLPDRAAPVARPAARRRSAEHDEDTEALAE